MAFYSPVGKWGKLCDDDFKRIESNRQRRKIRKKTARNMLTWHHYDFRQKLKTKAEEMGVEIVECTEEYTSKTCGNCGFIKQNLGGAKLYRCNECGISLDRDLNGARNIFLKNHCKNL